MSGHDVGNKNMAPFIGQADIRLDKIRVMKPRFFQIAGPVGMHRNQPATKVRGNLSDGTVINVDGVHLTGIFKGLRCEQKHDGLKAFPRQPDAANEVLFEFRVR